MQNKNATRFYCSKETRTKQGYNTKTYPKLMLNILEIIGNFTFIYTYWVPLGKKLGFSTMVSTLFQLHFEVENIISNYRMFFPTQNDFFNYLPK